MDKKENKRSLKHSTYFQYKPKKTKKTMLFSIPSTPSLKLSQDYALKKYQQSNEPMVRTSRISNKISLPNKQYPDKVDCAKTLTTRKHKKSGLKFFQEQNKFTKQQFKNNRIYKNKQMVKLSGQRQDNSPKAQVRSFIGQNNVPDNLANSRSLDSQVFYKQIKKLSDSVQKYKRITDSSVKKLRQVQEKAKNQQLKYQRAKQIYIERIKTLTRNINSNKRMLGHLFTYQQMDKNIVPKGMILEVSGEQKSMDIRQLENEIQTYEQYFKSTQASLVSQISVNSKQQNY